MKPLSELDHYEILEIPRDASRESVERAYRLARSTFAEDALASYSVLSTSDSAAMRERVETAYRVLADAPSRQAYDAALRAGDRAEAWERVEPEPRQGALAYVEPPAGEAAAAREEPVPALGELEEIDEGGVFDGARLRRSRLRRGLEIEDVARITKVNPTYLRFIEDERFEALPARVYTRGFVTAYASCVGLPPDPVASDYMRLFDAGRAAGGKRPAPRR